MEHTRAVSAIAATTAGTSAAKARAMGNETACVHPIGMGVPAGYSTYLLRCTVLPGIRMADDRAVERHLSRAKMRPSYWSLLWFSLWLHTASFPEQQ
ncbi:hypothetical protein RvY_04229 [Ramazzottius varieornatus]|uniref:Uncharacterized protein n=1 Tax=Ramazzottius varieornatus TaxID=947166 RepID=A0A1D1UQZ6_RAMVA|nr:hypothetical protein RvY_04229 [Ramazzottius varieornatus]